MPAFTALGAVGVVCAATASFILAASLALGLGASAIGALVVGQFALVAVPIVIVVATQSSARALGLAWPRGRLFAAAALVGGSAWVLTSWLAGLLPHRTGDRQHLEDLAQRPSALAVYLGVAVVPAVCEEIVFRGVLARGLATHLHAALAVLMSAALFAVYHLNLAQLTPAFLLGLALGFITLRDGSAVPAMLAHALNNGLALLVARGDAPGLARTLDEHPQVALAGAAMLTAGGLALAATTSKASA